METINNSIRKEFYKRIAVPTAISGEIGLAADAAGQIISVSARAFTVSRQNSDKSASVTARAVFNVIYKGEETDNYESALEFNVRFEDPSIVADTQGFIEYRAEDVKITRSGAAFAVSANVFAEYSFPVISQTSYIEDVSGILTKKRAFRCMDAVCSGEGEYELEEEKDIAVSVKKVLFHDECVTITDVQCGIGTIIADGEVFAEFILLPFGGGEPVRENMTMPFRYELECSSALPEMHAIARAAVKQCSYKIYVDEEKSRSTITANMTLSVFGEAFRIEERLAVDDAFSQKNELTTSAADIEVPVSISVARYKDKCFGEAACEKKKDYKVKTLLESSITALNYYKENGKLLIDGILRGNVLTADADNNRECILAELPFTCSFDFSGDALLLTAAKRNAFAKELDGKAVLECELYFTVTCSENQVSRFTAAITEGAAKAVDDCAIGVIFIKAGDDLWEVSKKAGLDGETLLKQNPDLNLPADKNRSIVVYKRLPL